MSLKLNRAVAQAGFVFGLTGGLLNAFVHDLPWTLLCFASMTVCLINLQLLKEPAKKEK